MRGSRLQENSRKRQISSVAEFRFGKNCQFASSYRLRRSKTRWKIFRTWPASPGGPPCVSTSNPWQSRRACSSIPKSGVPRKAATVFVVIVAMRGNGRLAVPAPDDKTLKVWTWKAAAIRHLHLRRRRAELRFHLRIAKCSVAMLLHGFPSLELEEPKAKG